jgi:hypothetical protein
LSLQFTGKTFNIETVFIKYQPNGACDGCHLEYAEPPHLVLSRRSHNLDVGISIGRRQTPKFTPGVETLTISVI